VIFVGDCVGDVGRKTECPALAGLVARSA